VTSANPCAGPARTVPLTSAMPRILAILSLLGACQVTSLSEASWTELRTGTDASLRGLHAVDAQTVWASGSKGTVVRSIDGGQTFEVHRIPGEESNELRDVHAFDADHAFVLACQPARIYRTADGGASFEVVLDAGDAQAFFDGLSFFDRTRGVAFGDPIDGVFLVYTTSDGGATWRRVPAANLPPALDGEGGFAASGTCLTVAPGGLAWIATGIAGARVLRSEDAGHTWTVATTPMSHGEASGIFSLAFRTRSIGVAVGGDYRASKPSVQHAATTSDGGKTWQLPATPPRAYRSCAAYLPGGGSAIAVGPAGTDYSDDDGRTWYALSSVGFHVVSCAPDGSCFAAGSEGRIARLVRR